MSFPAQNRPRPSLLSPFNLRRKATNSLRPEMKSVLCLAAWGLTLGLAVSAGPAAAHHSFAMFDQTKTVTFRGTIKDFQWSNPHAVVCVIPEPLHDKTRIVADGQGLLHSIGFEVANDRAIASKHAQLADFLTRLAKAERWEGAHKDEYAAVLAKETGLPLDVALYTVSKVRGIATPIDSSIIGEEHDTLSHYLKAGVITTAPDLSGAFDTSFNASAAP